MIRTQDSKSTKYKPLIGKMNTKKIVSWATYDVITHLQYTNLTT